MHVHLRHFVMPIALVAVFHSAAAQDEKLLVKKELSLRLEIEAAQAAIDACAAKHVSVHAVVLGPDAGIRLLLIPDGARYDTLDGVRGKAYTAAMTGQATIDLMKHRADNPPTLPSDPMMVFLGGAVPIKIGSELIGVLSAGGGSPEQDAQCAQAGLDKIQPYLK